MFPDLQDIKEAFITLSPSRPTGFGIGFISLIEIYAYTLMFPIDDTDRLIRLLRAMDSVFVEAVEKKNRKE